MPHLNESAATMTMERSPKAREEYLQICVMKLISSGRRLTRGSHAVVDLKLSYFPNSGDAEAKRQKGKASSENLPKPF